MKFDFINNNFVILGSYVHTYTHRTKKGKKNYKNFGRVSSVSRPLNLHSVSMFNKVLPLIHKTYQHMNLNYTTCYVYIHHLNQCNNTQQNTTMVVKGKNIYIYKIYCDILYSTAMSIQQYSNLPMEGTDIIQHLVRLPMILIMPQNVLDVLDNSTRN